MIKKLILVFVLSFTCYSLSAQPKGHKFDKEKYKAELHQYITRQASLTSQEASAFFPLYEEMVEKQRSLFLKRRKAYRAKPAEEKACRQLLLNLDKHDIEIKEIQAAYHKKMLNVLSASKLYDVLKAEEDFQHRELRRMAHKKH